MKLSEMNEIMAALMTPFDADGKVNLNGVRDLIAYQLSLGVRSFYVCGTSGEGFSMSAAERKQVVEVACDQTKTRGGIIVNISHMEFDVAMDLARHAASAGAAAVSTLPPLFLMVSAREIEMYYRRVLDGVSLPLTIYNIPMLSNRQLDEALVTKLLDHPNFAGIKHSSEDSFLLNRFKQIGKGKLMVWSGRDAYYLGALAMGADGAIGNSFNLMGDLFVKITEAYRKSDIGCALMIQQKANEIHRRLQVFGGTQSVKRCLQLLGINAGHCRMPYQQLPESAEPLMREIVDLLKKTRQEL
jgi:N-acetylneuraminate lyase